MKAGFSEVIAIAAVRRDFGTRLVAGLDVGLLPLRTGHPVPARHAVRRQSGQLTQPVLQQSPLVKRTRSSRVRPGLMALVVALCTSGCASSASWPRVISTDAVPAVSPARGEWIDTYDQAIASIARIMTGELALPPVQASLYFYPDREAFRGALEAEGYTPSLARQTADTLTAVSGFRRVLINDRSLADVGWLFRIALVAHEMAHTLQYEWSGGTRGNSEQWLREGFAEWVEVEVLVRLGFTTRRDAQRVLLDRLRDAGVRRLPALSRLATFPEWVDLAQRFGQEALYGYAMLAAQHLLDQHGQDAAIDYFRRFASSDDGAANFRQAFGQEPGEFQADFNAHLAALLR